MLVLVVERFRPGVLDDVRERFMTQGRLMPDGVEYVDSWFTPDGSVCYQIVQVASLELLSQWTDAWSDLVAFETVPIVPSQSFWADRAKAEGTGR